MKCGIDTGLKGAVAFVDGDSISVHPMPTMIMSNGKRVVDGTVLYALLISHKVDRINIEVVHAMPRQGVVSMFTFGRGLGAAETAAGIAGDVHYITPQKWKARFNLIGKEKSAAVDTVMELYPDLVLSKAKEKRIAEAEAVLIALTE